MAEGRSPCEVEWYRPSWMAAAPTLLTGCRCPLLRSQPPGPQPCPLLGSSTSSPSACRCALHTAGQLVSKQQLPRSSAAHHQHAACVHLGGRPRFGRVQNKPGDDHRRGEGHAARPAAG